MQEKMSRDTRHILANQYRILGLLDPRNQKQYAAAVEVLENGFELEYDGINQSIASSLFTTKQCEELIRILRMYRELHDSYEMLDDKSGIDPADVVFPGFDGNGEPEYLSYGEFLNNQGKFQESKVKNSHHATLDMYSRMLAKLRSLRTSPAAPRLTASEIKQVLAEKTHPSMR